MSFLVLKLSKTFWVCTSTYQLINHARELLSCFLNTEGASALEAAVLVAKQKIPVVSQNFSTSCCLFLNISMSST